jgi:hypothetical protein
VLRDPVQALPGVAKPECPRQYDRLWGGLPHSGPPELHAGPAGFSGRGAVLAHGHRPSQAGECFKMFQTFFKIFENVLQNASKCFDVFQSVSKCFKMFQTFFKIFQTFFKTFQDVSMFFKMFQNVSKCLNFFSFFFLFFL